MVKLQSDMRLATEWQNAPFSQLFKIKLPLIQAPMAGGASTPELVAAVSNAGGLGSVAAGYMAPNEIRVTIRKIRQLTALPFAVNLFIPEKHEAAPEQIEAAQKAVQVSCPELSFKIEAIKPPYAPSFDEQLTVLLEEEIPIFSFTFGIPSAKWIDRLKHVGIKLIGTATHLEEAKHLEESNIDAIVAQGSEAGGHRGTFLGKAENALVPALSLTALLKEHIKVPIIAAGGIMNAQNIVKSLKQGAAAVQMGTAFLCCTESGIHPLYKQLLLNSHQDITTLTRAFSGKLARGIINQFITRMQDHQQEILDYPIQNALTAPMRKEAAKQDNTDFMSLWAGQFAYQCKAMSATQFISELREQLL